MGGRLGVDFGFACDTTRQNGLSRFASNKYLIDRIAYNAMNKVYLTYSIIQLFIGLVFDLTV
jgi:hypothetical protein